MDNLKNNNLTSKSTVIEPNGFEMLTKTTTLLDQSSNSCKDTQQPKTEILKMITDNPILLQCQYGTRSANNYLMYRDLTLMKSLNPIEIN